MLKVQNVKKYFSSGMFTKRYIRAVDGVSFDIEKGECLGLVGESGCGKTTIGRLILRLIEPTEGKVLFQDTDIFKLKPRKLRELRPKMQMIFQDPESSLNPRKRIGDSILEPLKVHNRASKKENERRVLELTEMVGLGQEHLNRYPHELSGGENQRAAIARILTINPEFVIADEATSSLDVSVQAQILSLMKKIQYISHLTYLFISHDLHVVGYMSDRIAVMYLGKIVEIGKTKDILNGAMHPYTQALLSAIPEPGLELELTHLKEEASLVNPSSGCRFLPRCAYKKLKCEQIEPGLAEVDKGHQVACHLV